LLTFAFVMLNRQTILSFLALLLMFFFISNEANLFWRNVTIGEEAKEEREIEQELFERREWEKNETKWTTDYQGGTFGLPHISVLFYNLHEILVYIIESFHFVHLSQSSLYILFCSLKIDCS